MTKLIIKDQEQTVGTATVEEEGLYYRIRCVCDFPKEEIHKLMIKCGKTQVNLGTCLLEQDKFILNKRISIRSLGRGELQIITENDKTQFCPIRDNIDFPYIAELPQKKLEFLNGNIGITIHLNPVPPDSDQNPAHPHE